MKMTDMLGCVGWAVLFLFATSWIPFLGPFFSLLTPLPFLYYSTKLGLKQGGKLTALTVLTIGLIGRLLGHPQIILFGLELGLLGLALSVLFKWRVTLGQIIFLGIALMVTLGLVSLSLISFSKGMGPMELVLAYLQGQLDASIKAYEGMGISKENALELRAFGKAFMHTISRIYPSLMTVAIGFTVWLNIVIARPVFRIGNLVYPDFTPMDHWKAADGLVWGVIVSGFALFLPSGGIKLVAINALIVVMAVYMFQGLSIVLFFLNKYGVPSWARIGVYFLIVAQQLFLAVLALAGLFDQWVDFRKIHRKKNG